MPLTRISITIPKELVEAADRKVAELDRSRSWLLVEALRRYLSAPVTAAHEPQASHGFGLGASRQAELHADLALTPEQRVMAAEQTRLVEELRGIEPRRERLETFDRYEDYLAWRQQDAIRL